MLNKGLQNLVRGKEGVLRQNTWTKRKEAGQLWFGGRYSQSTAQCWSRRTAQDSNWKWNSGKWTRWNLRSTAFCSCNCEDSKMLSNIQWRLFKSTWHLCSFIQIKQLFRITVARWSRLSGSPLYRRREKFLWRKMLMGILVPKLYLYLWVFVCMRISGG